MIVPWSIILKAAGPVKQQAWKTPVLWTTLALVVVLLFGAVVIAFVDRWRKQRAARDRLTPGEQLTQFRAMYDRGELSREEFERIRALLGERLRKELELPAAPPPAPENPPQPEQGRQPEQGQQPEQGPPAS